MTNLADRFFNRFSTPHFRQQFAEEVRVEVRQFPGDEPALAWGVIGNETTIREIQENGDFVKQRQVQVTVRTSELGFPIGLQTVIKFNDEQWRVDSVERVSADEVDVICQRNPIVDHYRNEGPRGAV